MFHRNELGQFYQDHYKKGLGVEVGVQDGYFSQEILKNWKGELKCVDRWDREDQYNNARMNLGEDRLVRGDSADSAKLFKAGSLDFVFIDAGHQYEEVKRDLEAWFPKVRKGGVFSGHDYVLYGDFGVIKAVDEFAKSKGYKVELTDQEMWEGFNFKSWYFIK